jgi:hypothetical protein
MFTPFAGGGSKSDTSGESSGKGDQALDELKAEMARMQRRLDELSKKD